MSLLPLIMPGEGDEAQNAFLAQVPPINLFRAAANAPKVGQIAAQFGGVVLYQTALDPHVREIAILRAAHLAGNAYEVGHHERIGRDLKMSEAQLDAVRPGGDVSTLTPAEQLAVRWSEAVISHHKADATLVAEALSLFGERQTVELSMTVGYYLMIAFFLDTFQIPFEGADFQDGVKINR